jgi:glutaryl-CoA dehydrogenase
MDFSLTEAEQDLAALCRDFAQKEIAVRAPKAWDDALCPTDLLREMGALGLLGMLVPEEWGGIGMTTVGFVAAMEQLGLADQSVAAAWQAHVTIGSLPLLLFGNDEQRERWLRPLAEGRVLGAFGLTEPDAGSDARGIQTRAVRHDGGWLINGRKTFISNAGTDMSFGVTLLARTETGEAGDAEQAGSVRPSYGTFVVEKDTPGFTTVDLEDKIALRAVQNALITLEGVRVPEENRLQEAHSFRETANVLRMTRAGVAWSAVGCSRGAYEHALRYAMHRTQFDKPIIEFQMVQDLLVKMLGNITASAAMCARLSQLQGEGRMADEHASMAKAFCTVRMRETVGWARELMGGNGILLENHVGRYVADAEAIYSYEGTREVNTLIVGRAVTGASAIV